MRDTTNDNLVISNLNGISNVTIIKDAINYIKNHYNDIHYACSKVDGVLGILLTAYNDTCGREILRDFYDITEDDYSVWFYEATTEYPYGVVISINKFINTIEKWIEDNTLQE